MYTTYELLAQARDREVARNASHPSRLMAYDLRLARATPHASATWRPAPGPWSRPSSPSPRSP